MSVDLGYTQWSVVGLVDGYALLTNWMLQQSRWIDLRTWPGKLLPIREEFTRAVCAGATLAGWKTQTIYTWKAPDKRRTERKLPMKKYGYRTIGVVGGRVMLVPGYLGFNHRDSMLVYAKAPILFDRAWKTLEAEAGEDPRCTAVIGDLVVYGGRVLRYEDDKLVKTDAGELPRSHPSIDRAFVSTSDGFITAGGGKLVIVSRAGRQREDRKVGKLHIANVARYEDKLLLSADDRYWLYNEETREHEAFDLGLVDPVDKLILAPCGVIALVDQDKQLVRLRG